MAKRCTTTGRRLGSCIAAALLLSSVGCGWTHGRYQTDPMLGNFNRPIAATPPIYTGGDPGVSPAYDTGARLGLPSPDVVGQRSDGHSLIIPTHQGGLGMGGLLRGISNDGSPARFSTPLPTSGNGGGASFNRPSPQNIIGARLPAAESEAEKSSTFVAGMVSPLPNSALAAARSHDVYSVLRNGSSIVPDLPPAKADPVRQALKNPEQVATIEEAHSLLTTCGAKTQALEQSPTGEWRFVCTMGDGSDFRRYEAKHNEPIEAVRAVLLQVSNEK